MIVEPGGKHPDYSPIPEIEGDGYDILSKQAANAQYFDVALGASITGFARAALWRAKCASQGVVYCDTDSLIARKFGGVKGDNLGEWKKECDLSDLHIGGKKLYCGKDTGILKKLNDDETSAEDCVALISLLWKTAHKGFSKLDTNIFHVQAAAKGEIIEIQRTAPSIKISGAQIFIKRRMRKT